MKLVERVKVDTRDSRMSPEASIQNILNERLLEIQQRRGCEVLEIKEVNKDNNIVVFLIVYEDNKVAKK